MPIASCARRSSCRPESSRLDGSITRLLSRRASRRSPTRVMATAAAVALNQAMIQATEAPRAAITVIQIALASQQAPAMSISRDRQAAPAAGQGSGTGSAPDASGSFVIGQAASALRVRRAEMLGKGQVTAPLMAQRAAHGALRPAHRRLQPGAGVSVQLARLRLSREPQLLSPCQLGREALVLGFALFTPAASRPGSNRAMAWQRGREVAPCSHTSTVEQHFR